MSTVYVLWDDSHIWGLLLRRAVASFGIDYRIVQAQEIADGLLSRKPCGVLLVPGGNAKRKQQALGRRGMNEIREYVSGGGAYVGFCGGAGLGLAGKCGLGLCPWKRRGFADRLQHFVSGHMVVKPAEDSDLVPDTLPERPLAPVWWPARFDPHTGDDVRVLAEYRDTGPDFWIADLPIKDFPPRMLEDLETQFKINVEPRFMIGQPVAVEGEFGKGRYVLSYSHLETPASRDANRWLAHILSSLGGFEPIPDEKTRVPAWPLGDLEHNWPDTDEGRLLYRACDKLSEIISVGESHLLLFRRNPWLLGWRRGIPGSNINSLYALACEAAHLPPTDAAEAYLSEISEDFARTVEEFRQGTAGYLMAERLAMTMSESANPIPPRELKARREALFGPPMELGGLHGKLQGWLEELVRLQLI
jgi:hypothetical protein